jgi:hypothetical protein
VGKGKRADIYLEVRKRRGHIFKIWPNGFRGEEF